MIRDRELHKVTGDSFVPKNRPRIFDRGTQVKILRLRIVGGNKKEPDRVLIVNPRWIHEAARARRLERFWQLPNLKLHEVIRQSDKLMRFQKIDHLGLAAFIRLQECREAEMIDFLKSHQLITLPDYLGKFEIRQ